MRKKLSGVKQVEAIAPNDLMFLNHYNRRHLKMENQKNLFQLLNNALHVETTPRK